MAIAPIIAGRRTAWAFALLPILLAVALIVGVGEADHTTDSRDNLPENADSTAAAFLLDELPDEATEAAIVLWTADSGKLSDEALSEIKGQAEGDFVRNFFKVTDARTERRLIDKAYGASDLSVHYGADEQIARDIARHLVDGAPLPVSIVDALEAGLLALTMDDARRTRTVIDMAATWRNFDAALAGAAG